MKSFFLCYPTFAAAVWKVFDVREGPYVKNANQKTKKAKKHHRPYEFNVEEEWRSLKWGKYKFLVFFFFFCYKKEKKNHSAAFWKLGN